MSWLEPEQKGGGNPELTRTREILTDPPAELALLLKAISVRQQTPSREEFHRLADAVRDWKALLMLATRHHVTPLLYLGLKRASWVGVPQPVQVQLKARFAANLKRNFRLVRHATAILKAFESAGVPVMPVKGVFLAESFYGELSSREVSDIDLLIAPQDVPEARDILLAAEFKPIEILDQQQVFRQHAAQIEIDLHWQVSPKFFPVNYDFQQIWRDSVTTQLGGVEYHAPTAGDQLLLLCIQVAKDCWERRQRLVQLQKVCDIAAVIDHSPGLGWGELRQRAAEQGLTRVLHFALALPEGLLDTGLPNGLSDRVAGDAKAVALARQVCALPELAETSVPPEGNRLLDIRLRLRQLFFYLQLRELQRDKWFYPWHVLSGLLALKKRGAA